MASLCSSLMLPLALLLAFLCLDAMVLANPNPGMCYAYTHLFSFGDSITDTGNLVRFIPNAGPVTIIPYGETFFYRPSGRFCDGRLIVDFIAEALALPFLTPYMGGKTAEDFRHGANFAMAGATALSQDFFKEMGLDLAVIPPFSLEVQMEWFKNVLHTLGSTDKERKKIMSRSLFLTGEMGGNDYNHPFFQNQSLNTQIKPLVPKVVEKIGKSINVLIDLGAKTIVAPGNFPIGCMPRYLTMFQSENPDDYDAIECLKWLNDFSGYHNSAPKCKLEQIYRVYPQVTLIYGDYYGSTMEIITTPGTHGFAKENVLVACCGDGGPYNSNSLFACNGTSILCTDPSKYISWDGLHSTEAAYRFVAQDVLEGRIMPLLAIPKILYQICTSISIVIKIALDYKMNI